MKESLKILDSDQQNLIKTRIVSIDALRGFDMFWIIGGGQIFQGLHKVFDNPVTGVISRQMTHVKWEGFGFEDLIFPLFLFIVGLVMPFSILRGFEARRNFAGLYLRIIKRTVLLILLGMMMNGLLNFNWSEMRWMGVLQRIGLCYFFAAILVIHTRWRTQVIIVGAILVLYWAAMTLIPVPNYGPDVITPEGCLPAYIDRMLLPGVFNKSFYGYGDAEGILSTLTAICTTLLGVLAGHWLRSNNSGNRKIAGLAAAGLVCLITGYMWGIYFPIIKKIWTSSYVLVASGWSLLLLALFYWVIDIKGYRKWAFFFIVIGMNSILIYFLSDVVDFAKIANFFVEGIAKQTGIFAPLVPVIAILTVKWLLLLFLYRHKIFIKV
jgi:predicted acyltransferase